MPVELVTIAMDSRLINWLLPLMAIVATFSGISEAHSVARFNGTQLEFESMEVNNSLEVPGPNFRNAFPKNYDQQRKFLIEQEELKATGGHLKLSALELKVHEIFMKQKTPEMSGGFEDIEKHAAGMHFFQAKHLIEKSKVFQFLKEMPKGAILHVHNTASVSSEWVVNTLTHMPGMMSCLNADGVLILTFHKDAKKHECMTPYKLLSEVRAKAKSAKDFDNELEKHINLFTKHPEIIHNTITKVWKQFEHMFDTIGEALKYLPAYRAYHKRMLEEMYEDKIMYAELRMRFKPLFDQKGTVVSEQQSIQELIDVVNEFKKAHPDFLGIKVIYATSGIRSLDSIKSEFERFKKWHSVFPEFVIGFDLVGHEGDKKATLHSAVDVLKDLPKTAKFFFHAGETNWYGTTADLNILDAILMNTARIGHGYALLKHPVMRKAVQERDIALEVSPLSNQILNLVWDLRNHPAGFFLSEDVPMVITNDDPGYWGAKGLSYDFYYAIMSFAPSNGGLKTLKSIVWNSIKYSAMHEQEKKKAYEMLTKQWNTFLEKVQHGKVVKI